METSAVETWYSRERFGIDLKRKFDIRYCDLGKSMAFERTGLTNKYLRTEHSIL